MIKKLLRKLGLKPKHAVIADAVLGEVADRATGGIIGNLATAVRKRGGEKPAD